MKLALVTIARNEAPRIARLLASVAPWVDEMLVLDTGSSDDTVAVARAAGARVHPFDWCDDFAAARNAALDLAGADWHLVLDADEWLIEGGPVLAALRGEPPDFVGTLQLEDFGAADGVVQHRLSRVLPGPLRYRGRVHEQPQHRLPLRRLGLRVGHDGYSGERVEAKRGRNRLLLQAELEASPGDAYLWYQLGKDHAVYAEHEAAAQAFGRAEALLQADSPWRLDLATRHLFALKKAGRHAEGVIAAESRLQDCAASPDFFFALGDLLLDWCAENPAQAPTLLPMALDAWRRCLDIGEQPDIAGSVQGRGSCLAAHNLAVVHEQLGQPQIAADLRRRHPMPRPDRGCEPLQAVPVARALQPAPFCRPRS
ncbi:MAG: glycosyltransferase [Burkholderiales bacterium]|nr:glycosyltransferase [Burkholderiales bacterium]MDE2453001.1 glycosyltransferase [Burkholderiales bacterium]